MPGNTLADRVAGYAGRHSYNDAKEYIDLSEDDYEDDEDESDKEQPEGDVMESMWNRLRRHLGPKMGELGEIPQDGADKEIEDQPDVTQRKEIPAPFEGQICHARFRRLKELNRHNKLHMNEIPTPERHFRPHRRGFHGFVEQEEEPRESREAGELSPWEDIADSEEDIGNFEPFPREPVPNITREGTTVTPRRDMQSPDGGKKHRNTVDGLLTAIYRGEDKLDMINGLLDAMKGKEEESHILDGLLKALDEQERHIAAESNQG